MGNHDHLLKKKNVVGYAKGKKWTNGESTGEDAILVFVEQKIPLEDLDPDDIVENEINGTKTDVVGKIGKIRALPLLLEDRIRVKKLSHKPKNLQKFNKIKTRKTRRLTINNEKFEIGDRVELIYQNKSETGIVVAIAGKSEKGKLRIKIDGDNAQYREVPIENVEFSNANLINDKIDIGSRVTTLYKNKKHTGVVVSIAGKSEKGKIRVNLDNDDAQYRELKEENVEIDISIIDTNPRNRHRPLIGGISVGHYDITAGTIGGFFKDTDNDYVILSNNHVLANTNNARSGDPIIQPGNYDGGTQAIGKLKRFKKLLRKSENYQDSAIATIDTKFINTINKIGLIKGFSKPKINMICYKSGRTTGKTKSKIIALNGRFSVDYGKTSFVISGCIVTNYMSDGGDSGSLLLDGNNNAVGLLFAGSNQITIHNDIKYPVETYGLTII